MKWLVEQLYAPVRQILRIDSLIYHGRSAFQEIDIFENADLGRVLALDGVIQTTERDEFFYHEMLTHLPLIAHGAVKRVLIVGGGDGGMLEEVLKHPVEAATLVEIDPEVIELSRRHLPSICGEAFEDRRTEVVIADAAAFVADSDRSFDLIIVDSSDPIGPAEVLFRHDFYSACKARLAPGGLLVTQNGVPFYQEAELRGTHRCLAELFAHHGFYFAAVPTYIGGVMAFGWASESLDLAAVPRETVAQRNGELELATRYYNAEIHCAVLAWPAYLRNALED